VNCARKRGILGGEDVPKRVGRKKPTRKESPFQATGGNTGISEVNLAGKLAALEERKKSFDQKNESMLEGRGGPRLKRKRRLYRRDRARSLGSG